MVIREQFSVLDYDFGSNNQFRFIKRPEIQGV
jgi:hypothetical protein